MILAECVRSNSNRARAWKYFQQKTLCNPHQLRVTDVHCPSVSSNGIPFEHCLFSPISCNWSGRPLNSWETIINYICTTTNKSGLAVKAVRVTKQYRTGVKIN
ncbi:MAG: hypothetical protein F4246_03190 [Rhodothermaceae bacterium]|nr:hypothetical protein [Rhodothermaceae bacterium]MXX58673.1 hypothetical protein [Rhodothermaceae bacterium]MYD18517.1 hypothetical protein [Rhodothermaceae bacterium]MYD56002.1 hypothetical protein [Rhodothermaceae bacterium]MYI43270.1 hypothetical protein [Rhodothermaceae bacterium]